MKNMLRLLMSSLLYVSVFAVATAGVQAQSVQEPLQDELAEEFIQDGGVYVSQVNLSKAELLSGEENNFVVKFTVENLGDKIESGLKYGLTLSETQENGGQLLDEVFSDEVFNIAPGEVVVREMSYDMPAGYNGAYALGATIASQSGLELSPANVSEITVENNDRILILDQGACAVKISGTEGSYTLQQGVDISPAESLYVECELVNVLESDVEFSIDSTTHVRNIAGKEVSQVRYDQQVIVASATEKVRFDIEKRETPQAYVTKFMIVNSDGEQISNPILVRYVVQGESATVQHVLFDKGSYKKGDVANVTVAIASQADHFEGSRLDAQQDEAGIPSSELNYNVNTVIQGCSDEVVTTLGSGSNLDFMKEIKLPITTTCPDPIVSVTITNQDSQTLDAMKFSSEADEVVSDNKATNPIAKITKTVKEKPFVGIGIVVASFVLALIVIFMRRTGSAGMKALLYFGIGASALLSAQGANALSIKAGLGGSNGESVYSYSINESCNPSISGNVSQWGCGNRPTDICSEVKIDGNTIANINGTSGKNVSGALPKSGSARLELHVWGHCEYNSGHNEYAYDVERQNLNYSAQCGSPSKCVHKLSSNTRMQSEPSSKCTNGGSVRAYKNTGDRWSWECEGTDGVWDGGCGVYKAPSPVNGSCGSGHNSTRSTQPNGSAACSSGSFNEQSDSSTQFKWKCAGQNGGNTVSCHANKQPAAVNGQCGSANGSAFNNAPTSNRCNNGSVSNVTNNGFSWSCRGSNGGNTVSCSARQNSEAASCGSANGGSYADKGSIPQNALCNSSNGNSPVTGSFQWTCYGNNAPNVTCRASQTAQPVANSCGSNDGNSYASESELRSRCTNGSDSSFEDNGTYWSWHCLGQNGGSSEYGCTANKDDGGPSNPGSTVFCGPAAPTISQGATPLPNVPVQACNSGSNPVNVVKTATGYTWNCQDASNSSNQSTQCSQGITLPPAPTAPVCGVSNNGHNLFEAPSTGLCANGTASVPVLTDDPAIDGKRSWTWTCASGSATTSCSSVSDCGEGGFACNGRCEYISLSGQSVVNHDRSGGVVVTSQTITSTDNGSCIAACDIVTSADGDVIATNVPLGELVGDIEITHADNGEQGFTLQCQRKPSNTECNGHEDDGDCDETVEKSKTISCVCTARKCSAAGTCTATPVFGASSGSHASCSSECNSDADCGGGGLSESGL